MAYRLKLDAPAESLRETARDQLDAAVDALRDPGDQVEAVHSARKRIKKTRALLRLARPALRERDFKARNRALRDQGRTLSDARDAAALVETVEDLAGRNTHHVRRAHFVAVATRLARRTSGGAVPDHELPKLAAGVDGWPLEDVKPKTLIRALSHTYARGSAAYERAARDTTTENLHEWRKRVKDLWYQQQLLTDAWPEVMKSLAAGAKRLSKLLGSDHDLAVLAAELPDDDDLQPLIRDNRAELQELAFELGRRVYAESPKAFKKRLRRYVRASVTGAGA